MNEEGFARYSDTLRVQPHGPDFTAERLSGILRASRQAAKRVLTDQRRLVGVGTSYAYDALWRAGVDPSRPAATLSPVEVTRLRDELRDVLTAAVTARGTSF